MHRIGKAVRTTNETDVSVELNLDGSGKFDIETDIKFFKHMLEQFAYHSKFDLRVIAKSCDSDQHHLVEDVAIAMGLAFKEAIKDKSGINRYGQFILPMDEALVLSVVDISGRAFSKLDITVEEKISDLDSIILPHFFTSFAQNSQITVHIKQLDGSDSHHIAEAVFKSFGRALGCAVKQGERNEVPSTKGVL